MKKKKKRERERERERERRRKKNGKTSEGHFNEEGCNII